MQHDQASVIESEEFWKYFHSSAHIQPIYRYDIIANLIKELKLDPDTIIDLGCGNGLCLAYLKSNGLGKKWLGFDGALSVIEKNQKQWKFIDFHQADLQQAIKFPYKEEADLVICSEVIEHMPEYSPVFEIAYKQLKKGGIFILTTPSGTPTRIDIELFGHLRHFNVDLLAKEVASFGFTIKRKYEFGWPILNLQKAIASLFVKNVMKELTDSQKPSLFFKLAYKIVALGVKISSKRKGPQLIIVGQKPLE